MSAPTVPDPVEAAKAATTAMDVLLEIAQNTVVSDVNRLRACELILDRFAPTFG